MFAQRSVFLVGVGRLKLDSPLQVVNVFIILEAADSIARVLHFAEHVPQQHADYLILVREVVDSALLILFFHLARPRAFGSLKDANSSQSRINDSHSLISVTAEFAPVKILEERNKIIVQ